MNDNESFIRNFEGLIMQIVKESKLDQTKTGKIKSVLAYNLYNIEINGVTYTNVKAMDNKIFIENDIVWVVYPMGNSSDMFILGKK
jgi:acyl-ACP thioesterase